MPKQKSHRGAAKRFSFTKNGKVTHKDVDKRQAQEMRKSSTTSPSRRMKAAAKSSTSKRAAFWAAVCKASGYW